MPAGRILLSVLLVASLCLGAPPPEAAAAPPVETTAAFLTRTRGHYESALRAAGRWLVALTVDAGSLQKAGIKGKKKLAELLDALRRLESALPASERPPVRARILGIEAVTKDPSFHDMGTVSDTIFKQNSTSYLRIAYLLDRLGLDTKSYREEIRKILPRLDREMAKRGAHQRMAFHLYYKHFGLPEPFPLEGAFSGGTIALHLPPEQMDSGTVYSLAHEVFVPYEFGDKLDASFFTPKDLDYLKGTLRRLLETSIAARDPDLVGELASCMRYLRFDGEPVFRSALEFLLRQQRPDGAWGHYEEAEQRMGDLAKQALYLHTTLVVLGALTVTYENRQDGSSSRSGGR